jgi:tRNA threonylcarbamoyladenosine biosynthesis protein TsaE
MSEHVTTHHCSTVPELKLWAASLAALFQRGDVITLSGDLGAGKTELCRALIHTLCGEAIDVISPTFMLVQTYPFEKGVIWHYDLYRLTHADELYEIGIEEAFDEDITLIEWPEICASILPKDRLEIKITVNQQDRRQIALTPHGSWCSRLGNMKL